MISIMIKMDTDMAKNEEGTFVAPVYFHGFYGEIRISFGSCREGIDAAQKLIEWGKAKKI